MKATKKNNKRNGQGMTEYLIIVALIAIAAIVIIQKTSTSLRVGFGRVANSIQGDTTNTLAQTAVTTTDVTEKTMSDFNQ